MELTKNHGQISTLDGMAAEVGHILEWYLPCWCCCCGGGGGGGAAIVIDLTTLWWTNIAMENRHF